MLACDAQPSGLVSDTSCGRSSTAAGPAVTLPAQVHRAGYDRGKSDKQFATQLSDIEQQLAALTQAVHLMGISNVHQLASKRASSR